MILIEEKEEERNVERENEEKKEDTKKGVKKRPAEIVNEDRNGEKRKEYGARKYLLHTCL